LNYPSIYKSCGNKPLVFVL